MPTSLRPLFRPLALALALVFPARAAAQTALTAPGQPLPVDGVRPASMPGLLRSMRAPVAVHGAPGTAASTFFATLDAAERALDVLERTYAFPLPAPDGTRGGGPELDVYLVPDGDAVDTQIDALEYGALWDRASAFVRVRNDLAPDALRRAVSEGVAHAVLLGIDARTPRPWRIALASALAERVALLPPDEDAVRRFQRDPGAALIANRDDVSARGAALFPDFLAARYDTPDLSLLRRLAWLPIAHTPPDSPRFADEPDVFDVLARLFRDERGGLEGMLAEFSVARALAGSAGDTLSLLPRTDDTTLVPDMLAWIDSAQLPAWITPTHLLDETGAAYVMIDVAAVRASHGGIDLWFHGVPWRKWAVTVVRLDELWRDVGRAPSAPVVRGEWSTTMASLEGVTRVLVVIDDFGNGDYDPDDPPDRNGFFALNVARE